MIRRVLLVAVLVLLSPAAAWAQVRGRIDSCVMNINPVVFGTFSGSRIDTTGGIRLTCTGNGNGNPVTIALGEGSSNSFINRSMVKVAPPGPDHLAYNLYTDAARTTIWGNGRGETQLQTAILNFPGGTNIPRQVEFTVYARLEHAFAPVPGLYADELLVTVAF